MLRGHGIEADPEGVDALSAMIALSLQSAPAQQVVATAYSLGRDLSQAIDVAATPWLIGHAYVTGTESRIAGIDLTFRVDRRTLVVSRDNVQLTIVDLTPMVGPASSRVLAVETLDFDVDDRHFRLVVDLATVHERPEEPGVVVDYLDGVLFSSAPDN